MAHVPDPFESFREARTREGWRDRRNTDRAVYAHRIAKLLDQVEGTAETAKEEPLAPPRDELLTMIARLYVSMPRASEEVRLRLASFLTHVMSVGQRLLAGTPTAPGAEAEFEVDFNGLFEFMLNPDVEGLKHGR
jgi:hypothetical protein